MNIFVPKRTLHGIAGVFVLVGLVACERKSEPDQNRAVPAATFVGEEVCAGCHQTEAARWRGSHHELAMKVADSTTVLGDFNNAAYKKNGLTTTFFKNRNHYFVRTDGPDGRLHEYKIAYTFGVYPLQQYLVEFTGGRYQALSICWDARPAAEGGQRWFHLYPNEAIDSTDMLHWTGPYQNWNFMCAECHSTNLQKNYSLHDDRFATSWSEINVSCEACHGPGSRHVENARSAKPEVGLVFSLRDTSGGTWTFEPGQTVARRTKPLSSHHELETCACCHSRRAQSWSEYQYGKPLAATHRVALLDEGVYHADGQTMEVEEVYEYGSFLQSKMYAAGVTCSNCHEPHSLKLRLSGNAICTQCHLPSKYDSMAHHFHNVETAAAQCVSCHMAERKYMVIDGRRDHSFRVPRPDLSVKLQTPNACTDCHQGRSAQWATEVVTKWYGPNRHNEWHYGEALYAGRTAQPGALNQLWQTVTNTKMPGIVRATALSLLQATGGAESRQLVEQAVSDSEPLVRRAAATVLAQFEPQARLALGLQLLNDPIRSVRLEVLPILAGVPVEYFSAEQRATFERAVAEYRESQLGNADRAEAHLNLGILDLQLGNFHDAENAYRTAIRLQPTFIPAYINLADLYRTQNRESEAEKTLRTALQVGFNHADVYHALGLSLVRQQRMSEALAALAQATQLRPEEPRYAYVYAVALHENGDNKRAIKILQDANRRHPKDRDLLIGLIEYNRQGQDLRAAVDWAQKLVALAPNDADARKLLETLRQHP
ncbi:MAG: hypothetical protein ALAOOOJD_01473 [bacterium]|nr:hypothetical protein [bacterium]